MARYIVDDAEPFEREPTRPAPVTDPAVVAVDRPPAAPELRLMPGTTAMEKGIEPERADPSPKPG
jgi:hypothetical protein